MKIELGKYCVYLHLVEGEVVYVGKGRSYRPFETTRRNQNWISEMKIHGSFDVEIVGWFSTDKEARLEESKLIRSINPRLNEHQTAGYTTSETQKKASSIANSGKVVSSETRERISKAMSGKIPSNKGCVTSEEQKEKLRFAHKNRSKPVICKTTGETFNSTKYAAAILDIPASTLRAHLSGKLEHAKGMLFSYV